MLPYFIACQAFLALVAIIGNIVLLITVVKSERIQNISNQFESSLFLGDLVIGLFCIPLSMVFTVVLLNGKIVNHPALIVSYYFAKAYSPTSSSLNVTLMSFDRFVKVKWPLRYPLVSTRIRRIALVVLVWVLNLGFSAYDAHSWNQRKLLF